MRPERAPGDGLRTSSQQSTVIFALVASSFLIFEPQGLHGPWLRVQRSVVAWPFKD